jgi:hypothetical protein
MNRSASAWEVAVPSFSDARATEGAFGRDRRIFEAIRIAAWTP